MEYLAVCVLAVSMATVTSQPHCYSPTSGARGNFHFADTNSDGVLQLQEMNHFYNNYDANHDGRVSRHEYTEYQISIDPTIGSFAHALYDVLDSDGDHHLDLHDYQAFYRHMDSDGNDQVTEAEYVTYWVNLVCRYAHLHHQWCVSECTP